MWNIPESADQEQNSPTEEKYKKDKEALFTEIEQKRKEIFELIDGYTDADTSGDMKDLITKGMQMYVNGYVVNFDITSVEELPADKLKEDVKKQFQEKLGQIKEAINEKLYSLSESYESLREKLDDELEKAKTENSKHIMPDIEYEHAKKGLSVVKGSSSDELIWLQRGYYQVKTIDGEPIEPVLSEQSRRPVNVEVFTRGQDVVSVKIRNFKSLTGVRHYHSTDGGSTDCWGDWNYHQRWSDPYDIIDIANHALNILRDVNTSSPGESNPPYLPTIDALIKSKNKMRKYKNGDIKQSDSSAEPDTERDTSGNFVWSV